MFLESPRFPSCPGFGYVATPDYSVTISATAGGRERRNRNWSRPILKINCTCGPKRESEIEDLTAFWHAMGGPECGFRFKDWSDFKSCKKSVDVTPFDQSVEMYTGSPGGAQLIKTYQYGTRTQTRPILKPVQGTIRIASDGVEKTEGSEWVLDYSTGLLTFFFSPGVISWGGEFDVPVRFDSEFPIELVNHKIESVTFALRELRDPFDT